MELRRRQCRVLAGCEHLPQPRSRLAISLAAVTGRWSPGIVPSTAHQRSPASPARRPVRVGVRALVVTARRPKTPHGGHSRPALAPRLAAGYGRSVRSHSPLTTGLKPPAKILIPSRLSAIPPVYFPPRRLALETFPEGIAPRSRLAILPAAAAGRWTKFAPGPWLRAPWTAAGMPERIAPAACPARALVVVQRPLAIPQRPPGRRQAGAVVRPAAQRPELPPYPWLARPDPQWRIWAPGRLAPELARTSEPSLTRIMAAGFPLCRAVRYPPDPPPRQALRGVPETAARGTFAP